MVKKLVASDFKNNRVSDPTAALSEKQVQKIKKYVKDFLDRAVVKYDGHQERKSAHTGKPSAGDDAAESESTNQPNGAVAATPGDSSSAHNGGAPSGGRDDVSMSEADNSGTPSSPDRKRKRETHDHDTADSAVVTTPETRDMKRPRENAETVETPPPPPPLLLAGLPDMMTPEKQALREQEEALERENEEAQRLEDEANETKAMEEKADELQREQAEAARSTQNRELLGH
jgi:[histone H3]-lysine36 N-trimethyltransferase